MVENATLPDAAPADAGQPASQAVSPAADSAPVSSTPAEAAAAPASIAETAPAQPSTERLWANKYKAPEVLEEAYLHSQSENSRMSQRLAALERQVPTQQAQPQTAQPPTYTPQQLESWKEQRLLEMAGAAASGDTAKAQEATRQISMIDAELRKMEIQKYQVSQSQQQAYQSLQAKVAPLIAKYKDDIMPGTPLYNEAVQIYNQAVAAGAPNNEVTSTSALILALANSGKLQEGVAVKSSQQATQHLNQAIKAAAAAGSGAANTHAAATPDLHSMDVTTKEGRKAFNDYRKKLGVA